MIEVSGSVQIEAPVEDVFAFMDEPANQAVITPSLAEAETVEELDNGGKRARYTYSMVGKAAAEPFVRRYNERELETTLQNLETRMETEA